MFFLFFMSKQEAENGCANIEEGTHYLIHQKAVAVMSVSTTFLPPPHPQHKLNGLMLFHLRISEERGINFDFFFSFPRKKEE